MSVAIIDLAFPVAGTTIPVDHGYALFAALSRVVPGIHACASLGVHPIQGRLCGDRQLALTNTSAVTLRGDLASLLSVVGLTGQTLSIAGRPVTLGAPVISPLVPARHLVSRMVTVRGYQEPVAFLDALQRQMVSLNIHADILLMRAQGSHPWEGRVGSSDAWVRRTLCIAGREIVGYAVQATAHTDSDSLALQARGLGGRRRFGCGVFVPARES